MTEVAIGTAFITLGAFLKFSGACDTGGAAKAAVQEGAVLVNGQACTQRGKKLVAGDEVKFGQKCWKIVSGGTAP